MPKLTDLDHDGDFDILLGGYRRGYDQNNEAIDIPVYFYAKTPVMPLSQNFWVGLKIHTVLYLSPDSLFLPPEILTWMVI